MIRTTVRKPRRRVSSVLADEFFFHKDRILRNRSDPVQPILGAGQFEQGRFIFNNCSRSQAAIMGSLAFFSHCFAQRRNSTALNFFLIMARSGMSRSPSLLIGEGRLRFP